MFDVNLVLDVYMFCHIVVLCFLTKDRHKVLGSVAFSKSFAKSYFYGCVKILSNTIKAYSVLTERLKLIKISNPLEHLILEF